MGKSQLESEGKSIPIVKRQSPLHPEGEYCGQARKVTQEWSNPKPRPDGTTPESVQLFRVPLWTQIGKPVTAILRIMDTTGWMWEAACKSGEMIPPDGEEFRIAPDDLENRVFYFGITHREYNGVTRAEVKFHTKAYAIQQNPALERVSFPNEAPRPIYLPAATSPGLTPPAKPPAEPARTEPPPADSTPGPAAASTPPVTETKAEPLLANAAPAGISEDEFREALAYAKRLAAEKQNPPKAEAA